MNQREYQREEECDHCQAQGRGGEREKGKKREGRGKRERGERGKERGGEEERRRQGEWRKERRKERTREGGTVRLGRAATFDTANKVRMGFFSTGKYLIFDTLELALERSDLTVLTICPSAIHARLVPLLKLGLGERLQRMLLVLLRLAKAPGASLACVLLRRAQRHACLTSRLINLHFGLA
jgi:hypothetical protein